MLLKNARTKTKWMEDKAAIYHSERELKDRMILEMKHEMIELQDAAKEHDKKVAELEKALEEAKKKNENAKAGSLADKANLVKRFNEGQK